MSESSSGLVTQSIDSPEAAALIERLNALQTALQTGAPNYDSMLFTIHQALKNNPDFVHILTPEQVASIVKGLEKKTNIVIVMEASKKTASKTKKFDISDI